MKKINLLNITIIPTFILFTACSNTEPKVAKATSIYELIGIAKPIQEPIQEITEEPIQVQDKRTSNRRFFQANVSPNIEYISYKRPLPEVDTYAIINDIESNAKHFLGTPYVWGATGPDTFDCSGFTQWVYRDVGITIPRVSREQARVGEFISFENLRRGDMIFFDTKKHRSGKVTHVGIYLGSGNFIHASSAGKKVVIYNFNQKEFYKKRFLWGRRVTSMNHHYASN